MWRSCFRIIWRNRSVRTNNPEGRAPVYEKREMLGPQGKCLISRVKSSRIGPASCLTHVAAETQHYAKIILKHLRFTPDNSENNSLASICQITHHRSALDRLFTLTAQFAHGCGVALAS